MPSCYWCNDSFGHRPDCPVLEVNALRARVAELEAILRRVDVYFQHTGKIGDLPVSVHALLPKLINHEDGTTVTPLPMWQP